MGRGHGAGPSGLTPAGKPRCQAQTLRGTPCAAFALPTRPWCLSHDPDRQADVRAARAKGGAAASKLRALEGRRAKLTTTPRLLGFTSNLIHDVVEGRLDPDVARVALYGCSIARQLAETVELAALAARIAALETERGARWRA